MSVRNQPMAIAVHYRKLPELFNKMSLIKRVKNSTKHSLILSKLYISTHLWSLGSGLWGITVGSRYKKINVSGAKTDFSCTEKVQRFFWSSSSEKSPNGLSLVLNVWRQSPSPTKILKSAISVADRLGHYKLPRKLKWTWQVQRERHHTHSPSLLFTNWH